MLSVSYRPHPSAHVVVARSRPAAVLALVFGLGAWPLEALAAAPAAPDAPVAPVSQHESFAEPREESYRDLLTLSYVLAPFFALGVGHTLAELEADDGVAAVGAGAMFLAPAAVHMGHGNVGHGPLALLGLAGSTAVGTLLGGVVGYNLDSLGCDPAEDSDGCDFAGLNGLVIGALLGGVSGYTGFAIYDVLDNGAVAVDEAPPADHASLQLWLSPLPAAKREGVEATSPFGGLQIGATLQM